MKKLPVEIGPPTDHRAVLEKKLAEYKKRVEDHQSPYSLLKRDIAEIVLNSPDPVQIDFAKRILSERHGDIFSEDLFHEAWCVIEDYARTGGKNC